MVEYREYESPLSEITAKQLNNREEMITIVTGCYPVPSQFGKHRKDANTFFSGFISVLLEKSDRGHEFWYIIYKYCFVLGVSE